METDASKVSIGGVLHIKIATDNFLPVAYKSHKLTNGKCHHPIYGKQLLAIVHCLEKWCCYLESQEESTALTDQKLLIYFKTQANFFCQQAHSMVFLEQFFIKIWY